MPKSEYPLVTIIILNWNGKKLLKTCLSSLFKLTSYPNYKVIVVDNGSIDGSVEFVKENFPQVDILPLDKNYGFAKGNNEGIKYALKKYNPDYVLLLNNDTKIIQKDWLCKVIESATANSIDLLSVKQMINEQKALPRGAINIFSYSVVYPDIDTEHTFLGGWFLLFNKKLIKEIWKYFGGIFPEEYFCYMEDSFLYWVVKILGKKTYLLEDIKLIHFGSKSTGGKGSPFAIKMCQRNSFFNLYVFYSPSTFLFLLPLYFIFFSFNISFRIFIQKDSRKVKSVLQGFFEGIRHLGRVRKYKKILRKIYAEQNKSDNIVLLSSTYKLFTEISLFVKIVNKFSRLYLKIFRISTFDS